MQSRLEKYGLDVGAGMIDMGGGEGRGQPKQSNNNSHPLHHAIAKDSSTTLPPNTPKNNIPNKHP